ncbi:protein OPY2, partial [Tremellales sp. Uapishka_1]
MSIHLFGRDNCVSCDATTPSCDCKADENCVLTSRWVAVFPPPLPAAIASAQGWGLPVAMYRGGWLTLTRRTCSQCPTIQCIKNSSASSSGSINPGVIAGPVVAVLVIASVGLFWWLRRKKASWVGVNDKRIVADRFCRFPPSPTVPDLASRRLFSSHPRRDLARLEQLAARARKAESAGFHLSQPSSPNPNAPSSAHSGSTGGHSYFPQPPPSADRRQSRTRKPLTAVPADVEYQDENGATIRVYNASRGIINLDPFSDRESISTNGSGAQSLNVIPIQYVPPSGSNDTLSKMLHAPQPMPLPSQAARTLDAARQNLFRPGQTPPSRPARSPDLDLRLAPSDARGSPASASRSGNIRDSYLSGNSAAPSYLSGSSNDVHVDAPRIMTSKNVQVGRLQQAEMFQFGAKAHQLMEVMGAGTPSPPTALRSDPFGAGDREQSTLLPPVETGEELDDDESRHGGSDGDLRFSMGSLGFNRDSVSSAGTERYLARPEVGSSAPKLLLRHGPRESMASSKSLADSLLGAFPMIPPHASPLHNNGAIPQSTSVSTLDHASLSRPPTSYKSPQPPTRPTTAHSTTDSLLGSFPFVPPNMDDMAELPSASLPTAAVAEKRE